MNSALFFAVKLTSTSFHSSNLLHVTSRYDGYDDAYGKASTSMAEESSDSGSPSGNRGDKRVRHRDVWNQQIKESNEKTKQQIKHGFKV